MLHLLKNRNFWIMLTGDVALIVFSYFFAYYLRFDGDIPARYFSNWMNTIVWILPLKLGCFYFFGLYRGMWRYSGIYDMINLIRACLVSSTIIAVLVYVIVRFAGFPRSIFIIDFLLTLVLVGGYRMGVRVFFSRTNGLLGPHHVRNEDTATKRLIIIGAGDAGEKLLREIMENRNLHYHVVGFVDDDPAKLNRTIHGIPVLGTLDDLEGIVEADGIDELVIAIPSASSGEMRRIVDACERTGLKYRTVPGLGELIEGRVSVSSVREVRYEDLLGRKPVELNIRQIGCYLTGKRVMVTGGAGSIGSELCRQIARFDPSELIIIDRNESGLYDIEIDLFAEFPGIRIHSVVGPIQNKGLMEMVFSRYQPQVVFHVAAYKHVPMMEIQPWEAVFNNIVGTQAILAICARKGVDRCVLVSTDKAVRPVSVMGASKRVDELLVQAYWRKYKSRFMAVRFGNVVGSAGSVVPLFQKQIERGGPVTVTHPEVTRYFMTISEACRLILQAGAIGVGGEIFILKMGDPVRIADMARDIIRLSGFRPDEDIAIEYIGLRPGEKLFEGLITEGEGIQQTTHEEIMVLRGGPDITLEELNEHIERLVKLAHAYDARGIREELARIVPEYTPQHPSH